MQHQQFDEEEEDEIDLESIEDEQTLQQLLDDTEDVDERKRIRDRLRTVQSAIRAQRDKDRQRWEDDREQKIRTRVKEADLRKQKTLQMYADMAKAKREPPKAGERRGDVEQETIRERVLAADDRKRRVMAAYEHAATSQPAGCARIVHYDTFSKADVSKLEPAKVIPKGSCCFGMSGGIPKVEKVAVKAAPKSAPSDDSHLDSRERAIRERVREADERKRRILAAYDMAARQGTGPKDVILQEFTNMDLDAAPKKGPKYDPCFRGLKV